MYTRRPRHEYIFSPDCSFLCRLQSLILEVGLYVLDDRRHNQLIKFLALGESLPALTCLQIICLDCHKGCLDRVVGKSSEPTSKVTARNNKAWIDSIAFFCNKVESPAQKPLESRHLEDTGISRLCWLDVSLIIFLYLDVSSGLADTTPVYPVRSSDQLNTAW